MPASGPGFEQSLKSALVPTGKPGDHTGPQFPNLYNEVAGLNGT